jgi:hypothetical protein
MRNLTVGKMSLVACLMMVSGFGVVQGQDPAAPEPSAVAAQEGAGVAWGDVDVNEVAKDLNESIAAGGSDEATELRDIVDTSVPPKVVKNFPKTPFLSVVFPLREGVVDSKELQQKLRDYVQNHLEQNVLIEEVITKGKGVDDKFKPQVLLVQTKAPVQTVPGTPKFTPSEPLAPKARSFEPQTYSPRASELEQPGMVEDPFEEPEGLCTPAAELLQALGYSGCCCGDKCFPFTAEMSYEVAIKAYQHGYYQDAKALAKHALKSTSRPEYLYLEALSELALGECQDALQAARQVKTMRETSGLKYLKERLSGPRVSKLQTLLKAMPDRMSYPPAPAPAPYAPEPSIYTPARPLAPTPTPPPPSI